MRATSSRTRTSSASIDAFVAIRRRGFDDLGLLLSGSEVAQHATLRRAVHRYNLHKHVRFLGYQTTETLAALYRLAAVFVFPSLYEGFGLSPLEAMASGTPVVASNVSSLPEVLGDAAVLVDPLDAAAIADGITRVLEDADLRADAAPQGTCPSRPFLVGTVRPKRVRRIYEEIEGEN